LWRIPKAMTGHIPSVWLAMRQGSRRYPSIHTHAKESSTVRNETPETRMGDADPLGDPPLTLNRRACSDEEKDLRQLIFRACMNTFARPPLLVPLGNGLQPTTAHHRRRQSEDVQSRPSPRLTCRRVISWCNTFASRAGGPRGSPSESRAAAVYGVGYQGGGLSCLMAGC